MITRVLDGLAANPEDNGAIEAEVSEDGGEWRSIGAFDEAGLETGVWTTWHPNGTKQGEGSFTAGVREGVWTWWRDNGDVWRAATYVDGRETNDK